MSLRTFPLSNKGFLNLSIIGSKHSHMKEHSATPYLIALLPNEKGIIDGEGDLVCFNGENGVNDCINHVPRSISNIEFDDQLTISPNLIPDTVQSIKLYATIQCGKATGWSWCDFDGFELSYQPTTGPQLPEHRIGMDGIKFGGAEAIFLGNICRSEDGWIFEPVFTAVKTEMDKEIMSFGAKYNE